MLCDFAPTARSEPALNASAMLTMYSIILASQQYGVLRGGLLWPAFATPNLTRGDYRMMNFQVAVIKCLRKYFSWEGRASRSEFWFFHLFFLLVVIVHALTPREIVFLNIALFLFYLGLFPPSVAVSVRRLHDLNKEGTWLLLMLVPAVGALILIVGFCNRGTVGDNRFGPDPLPRTRAVA